MCWKNIRMDGGTEFDKGIPTATAAEAETQE